MKYGTGKLEWNLRAVGLGIGVGTITMLSMTGLGAWLLERELVGLEWINYLAAMILVVSSFVGAKSAGASADRWLNPTLTGVGLWLVLVLIHLAGFDGGLKGSGSVALGILGGTGASMLLGGGHRRRKAPVRKYRNR